MLQALDDAHDVRNSEGFDPVCFFFQVLLLRESAMELVSSLLGDYPDAQVDAGLAKALEGDPRRALTLSIRRADALLRSGRRDRYFFDA